MGKSKISSEKQIETVKDYPSGKAGYKGSVQRAGNSGSAMRRWIFQYKTGGTAAFSPQKKNRPLAKLSEMIKVADDGDEGKVKSKTFSAITIAFR